MSEEKTYGQFWKPTRGSSENETLGVPRSLTAITNPTKDIFDSHVKKAEITILEVGAGVKPLVSCDLPSRKHQWIGCDPSTVLPENGKVTVNTGNNEIAKGSEPIFFTKKVEHLPQFSPDHIFVVAPNPSDIVDGQIFNDDFSHKFLDPKKEQSLVIVLDSRTWEADRDRKEAERMIKQWTGKNGFEADDPPEFFNPLSRDLGAIDEDEENWLSFRRN